MFLRNSDINQHTLGQIRHDLLMNFDEKSLFEGTDRRFSKVHIELPYPIHKPLQTAPDPVQDLTNSKIRYNKLLNDKRKLYEKDKKDIFEQNDDKKTIVHIPRHLLDFYMNERDPDKSFKSDYNIYYTGGVLKYLEIENCEFLIRPDVNNCLRILDLSSNEDNCIQWSADSLIYGIDSILVANENSLLIREKHKVSLLETSNKFEFDLKWTFQSDPSILDSKFICSNSRIGIALSNNRFQVRDVECDKSIFKTKNPLEPGLDNFQHFVPKNDNEIILLNRNAIKVLDIRHKNKVESFDPNLIDCNNLCTLIVKDSDLFLASRHYIMKTDLRYLKDVSYYSHSLISPPCYIDITTNREDSYLCVSSQNCDEKVLFTGYSPYSLPYKIPSISCTLKECRLSYPSLTVTNNLDDRLCSPSTTGLKVLNEKSKVILYSTNCFGEIFKQNISDYEIGTEEPVCRLFEWVNELEKPEPILHVTNFEEASKVRFMLNAPTDFENLEKYRKDSKADEFLALYGPRYARDNIKGTLAKDFVSIWYNEEGDSDDDNLDDVEGLPEVPAEDKVNNWIQKNEFLDEDNSFSFLNFTEDDKNNTF